MMDTTTGNNVQQEKRIFKPSLATPLFSSTGSSEDTEFVKSIIDAYTNRYRKLSGRPPVVNFHDSANHIRRVFRSRPHGKKMMDEVADILSFVEKLLPDEPIQRFLNRYLDTNIMPRNGGATKETQGGTKPGDGGATGMDKPAAAAPVQKKLTFRDVAEEYFSSVDRRGGATGSSSTDAEYSNYRSFLKPFMDRDPASITLRDVHGLLDDMYVEGRSMAVAEAALNVFNSIMTHTGNGRYAHLLDKEISAMDVGDLLALPGGEKAPSPVHVQETEKPSHVEASAEKLPLIDRVALIEKKRMEDGLQGRANRVFAPEARVSVTTYADAKRVLERGAAVIVDMVRKGSLSVHMARQVVDKFARHGQEELAHRGVDAIKTMLKQGTDGSPVTSPAPPDAYQEMLAAIKMLTDAVAKLDGKIEKRTLDAAPAGPTPPDPDRYLSARDFYKHVRERRGRRIG